MGPMVVRANYIKRADYRDFRFSLRYYFAWAIWTDVDSHSVHWAEGNQGFVTESKKRCRLTFDDGSTVVVVADVFVARSLFRCTHQKSYQEK